MKNYILKLTSGTTYKLYEGTTLVSDADLTTLFATAGDAYFSFDFNEGTPTATNELTITNSLDTAVITNTGLTDAIEEGKNYKGTWSANATSFDTFEELGGVAMDESQLSFLMGKVKEAADTGSIKKITQRNGNFGVDVNLLKDGTYYVEGSGNLSLYVSARGGRYTNLVDEGICSVFTMSGKSRQFYCIGRTMSGSAAMYVGYSLYNGTGSISSSILPVIDSLTSTSTGQGLSANQGKVLNDKIGGDLSSLTTTDKTSLINAINELNAKLGTIETTLNTINNGSES